jgi:hypothetical protein
MNQTRPVVTQQEILKRIRGEYLEMPGLRLSHVQAQRLWGLDAETCTELLDILVQSGFLCRSSNGAYGRQSDGAMGPPFQMAKAVLPPRPASRSGKTPNAA